MKKQDMIKVLVKAWVLNFSVGSFERENAFVHHDSIESRLNSRWSKDGIRWFFERYENGEDINYLMYKMC